MSELYFMNFAIDQLWDDKKVLESIFSVRVPQSTHLVRLNEDFPLLIAQPTDYVIGYLAPEQSWLDYLVQFGIKTPHHISLTENPYDHLKWVGEVRSKLQHLKLKNMNLRCFGISVIEENILSEFLSLSEFGKVKASDFIFLNSKFRLLEIAKQNSILIPESEILSSEKVQVKPGYLLKAQFSSGGGGNLDLSLDPKTQAFMLRKIRQGPNCEFISQKKHKRKVDLSYFGSTDDAEPVAVMEVSYDVHNLSFLHQMAALSNETENKLNETWNHARNFLLSHKYHGPFGIDAFETIEGELFTLIDLNVRWTKTHFIYFIAKRFGVLDSQWNCQRVRKIAHSSRFSVWWSKVTLGLKLNAKGFDEKGRFVIPIMVSGLTALAEIGPLEVTYLCGQRQGSIQEWSKEVFKFMNSESLWQNA